VRIFAHADLLNVRIYAHDDGMKSAADIREISPNSTSAASRAWIALLAIGAVLLAATLYGASVYGRTTATAELRRQGMTEASLKVALLRAVLERPRALPLVLSQDRDIEAALEDASSDAVSRVNRKLETLVGGSQASVIYVMDPTGLTISSSNWRQKDTFIGSNYAFRDYFTEAMKTGVAEQFAFGNVSKRPGLYISRRVDGAKGPVGVVTVKMEFDSLENDWRDSGRTAFVVDARGVALISTIPSWRFMTTRPLAPAQRMAIRESLQFGDAPLETLPLKSDDSVTGDAAEVRATLPGGRDASFLRLRAQAATTPWVLEYLISVEPVPAAIRQTMLEAFALVAPMLMLAGVLIERRRRTGRRLAEAQAQRAQLESRVEERTRDLSQTRDTLQSEIAGHRATEGRLQLVQQDLVAANRLAILGQVAAGVAHEINQPVATIRAYADNAQTFLDRGRSDNARENLSAIASLTDRIGTITEDLKALARKGREAPEAVTLSEAMDGAVMLLRSRFSSRFDALRIEHPSPDLKVLAHRIRLEQVLINLMQNALEALETTEDAQVVVSARELGDQVEVAVSDNGPGIDADILRSLFSPFNTSKPRGLGLGLVICKEILSDFGGSLRVDTSSDGATFTLLLKRA